VLIKLKFLILNYYKVMGGKLLEQCFLRGVSLQFLSLICVMFPIVVGEVKNSFVT